MDNRKLYSGGGGPAKFSDAPGTNARSVRHVRRLIFALLFTAGSFAGGFAWFANHVSALETPGTLNRADAIIVLTGGQFRINAAVHLLESGKGKRLLISGVNPATKPSDLRSATGAEHSLFACCVDIDHAALDTIGNAEESAKWIVKHDFRNVILVTNNYHMPRSLLEMRRLTREASLVPYPVVNNDLKTADWLVTPKATRLLFSEYTKYLAAVVRGAFSVRQVAVNPVTAASQ